MKRKYTTAQSAPKYRYRPNEEDVRRGRRVSARRGAAEARVAAAICRLKKDAVGRDARSVPSVLASARPAPSAPSVPSVPSVPSAGFGDFPASAAALSPVMPYEARENVGRGSPAPVC